MYKILDLNDLSFSVKRNIYIVESIEYNNVKR
jgi:hypothetical protein